MTGKLILMGNGKVVYVPPEPLTAQLAHMLEEEFARYRMDPTKIALILGEPVEVIDNRVKEPRDVSEVVLAEGD